MLLRVPNGLPLSRRERWKICPKTNDLVRAAVGYSGVLGRRPSQCQSFKASGRSIGRLIMMRIVSLGITVSGEC
jgi:hypothetical protein